MAKLNVKILSKPLSKQRENLIVVGKFRKEFRRTFECRCRWISGRFSSMASSTASTTTRRTDSLSMYALSGNPLRHNLPNHHLRPTSVVSTPSRAVSPFGAQSTVVNAPGPVIAAGPLPPVYPLRPCRSNNRSSNNSSAAMPKTSTQFGVSTTST